MVNFEIKIDDASGVDVDEKPVTEKKKRKRIEHVKVESAQEMASRLMQQKGIPFGEAYALAIEKKNKEISEITKARAEKLLPPGASDETRAFALSLIENEDNRERVRKAS